MFRAMHSGMSIARRPSSDSESTASRPELLAALGLAEAADGGAAPLTTRDLRAIAQVWPLFIAAQLCVILGAVRPAALIDSASIGVLLPLGLALLCSLSLWLLPARGLLLRLRPTQQMAIVCALSLATAFLTAWWLGALPRSVADGAFTPFVGQVALAVIAVSLFGHVRAPALAYALGMALGTVSLGAPGRDLISALILLGVGASTLLHARAERHRYLLAQANEVRSQRAQRLLTDYEEAGRGWFWETNRAGALTYISPTLERSLGAEHGALLGKKLTDLLNLGAVDEHEGNRTLGYHLSSRSTFTDVAVRAATQGDERWWALSGQPVINEYGQFQGFRGSGSDLTEMKRSQAEVTRLAQFDSLTGLANRVQMQRALEQAVIDARGGVGECALFLLDLDRFKNVNDTMGHPAGDALLREVSRRLKHVVGERGMVGRLGGDEFTHISQVRR
ncbi:diguanylate cyclase domain-containing protein [Sphingobium sp. DEHP117]|uniref:diguanylate cyclase domain-containing protein n=1 Tax=Sphingobium sp. DEHP117 TaxID=2993436 RepID=UPI0027D98949|nr:diguanylate cyclase [Sphingobium sp. DEHP117]